MSSNTARAQAVAALADQDWSAEQLEMEPRRASVVHSARVPAALSLRLEAEAARRGVTPSKLITELVEEGLAARDQTETVTLRVADLHRVIDRIVAEAA